MHLESFSKMELFVKKYLNKYKDKNLKIAELGSRDLNGSYKKLFLNNNWKYYGLDIEKGANVDICLKDPYNWDDISDDYFDVVISGQVFEHIEFPWLTIKEIYRVLKPNGLVCIIAPSKGPEHKVPVGCWRIYPDGIRALAKWANLKIVEVFTEFDVGKWGDTFAVLQKIGTNNQEKQSLIKIEEPKDIARKPKIYEVNQDSLISLLEDVEKSFVFHEENVIAYLNLGLVFINLNEIDKAESIFKRVLSFHLNKRITNRTTIIQSLINIYKYETYLEIGIDKGYNFFQIQAPYKIAVDPYFKFDTTKFKIKSNLYFFEKTSDNFFENVPEIVKEKGLDIVFIDGNHTYEQSYKDVINSLKYLNSNGTIVMHDCFPKSVTEASETLEVAKQRRDFDGSWLGEVYKTIVNLRSTRGDLSVYVIDCDCGVGLIRRDENIQKLNYNKNEISSLTFDEFSKNVENLLNLRTADWFWDYPYTAKLERYSNIAIFGLGKSGKMTYEFLSKYFPEKIKYFIDDNIKGEYKGIPIVTTDEFLKKYQDQVNVVVFGKYQHLNPKLIPNLKIDYLKLENIV